MITKQIINFEFNSEFKNNKEKLIDEIKDIFDRINISELFINKILPELKEAFFDGSTISYRNSKEGISFYFFTDVLSGQIEIFNEGIIYEK